MFIEIFSVFVSEKEKPTQISNIISILTGNCTMIYSRNKYIRNCFLHQHYSINFTIHDQLFNTDDSCCVNMNVI